MIVRISGEGQYRLVDADGRLQELDNALVGAVDAGEETRFRGAFEELLDYVRSIGERLSEDELAGSDLILPPADTTLAEAAEEFTGEGLIPD
jgi:hypothetical protein